MGEHIGIIGGGIELAMLMQAAMAGDPAAACRLGDHYREGKGFAKDPKVAFKWYARSALAGDADGQNNLGVAYEHGLGCRPNPKRAVKYYALAASQGCSTAQVNLGLCYLEGWGVPKDLFEAKRWLQKAANQREPSAVAKLAELEKDPATGNVMHKATPGRGGRWLESYWLLDRLHEWDCTGTELMLADTAQARNLELTERYGPPKITIFTEGVPDYVVLTWTTGAGSETRLKQYGYEREHANPPFE